MWHAGKVRIADTLQEALTQLFGDAPPTQEQSGGSPPAPPSDPSTASVLSLLSQAETEFQAADEALRSGDLAGYQSHTAKAREYNRQAREAAAAGPQSATTSTTAKPPSSA